MGNVNFLTGEGADFPKNLYKTIEELEECSILFCQRWRQNNLHRAGEVSERAMVCFDHIVGEIMRNRDGLKEAGIYQESDLEALLNRFCGKLVQPVNEAQIKSLYESGPGHGRLPENASTQNLTMEKLLNKVKHRNQRYMNFRVEGGRHILVISPERPASIVEFDVIEFCSLATSIAKIV